VIHSLSCFARRPMLLSPVFDMGCADVQIADLCARSAGPSTAAGLGAGVAGDGTLYESNIFDISHGPPAARVSATRQSRYLHLHWICMR
jgi:hypothetical protein